MKTALSSNAFLAKLLASPLFLRSDCFVGLIRDIAAGKPVRTPIATRADMPADDEDQDEPCYPWEVPIFTVENGVAVVEISGALMKGLDPITAWFYGCASTDRVQAALSELAASDDVVAVVLKIDSPGGMVIGIPELGGQIAALAATKLVVAVTDLQACSAAYWLASQATFFYTTASAQVGSIGTYIALYDYSEYLAQMGVKLELFKRGKFKAIGVTGNPLDDDARAFLDETVGRTNDQFLAAVRSKRANVADSTMEGQWFDGAQAVDLGLADKVVDSVSDVIAEVQSAVGALLSAPINFG